MRSRRAARVYSEIGNDAAGAFAPVAPARSQLALSGANGRFTARAPC